jgi:hypothetical protein
LKGMNKLKQIIIKDYDIIVEDGLDIFRSEE